MFLESRGEELAERYRTPIEVCTKDNINEFKFEGLSRLPEG